MQVMALCTARHRLLRFTSTFTRDSSALAPLRTLRSSPAAQQWLTALETAPCFVCGGGTHAHSHRVDCAVSGFPLTCSPQCDRAATTARADDLGMFRQIHDDLAYTTSEDAKTLLTHVLTRGRRAQRQHSSNPQTSTARVESWEAFVRQFTDDAEWLDDPRAVRLASVAYTFAATLSSFLPVMCGDQTPLPPRLELHVVGARAEAMMPLHIWEELADAHPHTTFEIKLVGDHVVRFPRKKEKKTSTPETSPASHVRLHHLPGLYHQLIAANDSSLGTPPDAYVLFNPGIGHPKLQASWRPTMELILRSGKPALLTSFSRRDQARDVQALRELMDDGIHFDFVTAPQANAFSSRCFQLDPSDVFAPIRTNSHVMVVRGQAQDRAL